MNRDPQLAFSEAETLMLDMDGTLLDLAYDNYMWLEHIPRRYAIENQMSHDEARDLLVGKFKQAAGDLKWYCLDHWSEDLGLDVVQLHHDVSHKIGFLPGALSFLKHLQEQNKRVLLVTNSHRQTFQLKDAVTGLGDYFDGVHSSHDYGHAKESQGFWRALRDDIGFDPTTTLFVDDSHAVLRSAREYGIAMLLRIAQPDTRWPESHDDEFRAVRGVSNLVQA